ncbi:MAG: zincin-like metallopeptidase toxin domain-containing protein [Nonlabens sp.]
MTVAIGVGCDMANLADIEGNGEPFVYHPLQPISIANLAEQETGLDLNYPIIPAFMLEAAEDKAFWSNVLTTAEYAVDIVSTFSGIGNILKAGRLLKVLNSGHKLVYRTKTATRLITAGNAAVGVIEVTSGTVNALLKLSGETDTPFGRAVSEYLFYLELLSLTGELTAALRIALKKSAEDVLEVGANGTRIGQQLERRLDELVERGEFDELGKAEIVEEVVDIAFMGKPREIGKLGGKKLRASEIRKLRGELKKRGGLLILEQDLNIKNVINNYRPVSLDGFSFEKASDIFFFMNRKGFAGAFDAKTMQMILPDGATDLVAFHEMAHLKHFEEIGDAYSKLKTWKKETYVWEQILSQKRKWTREELDTSLKYVNRERANAGITPLKAKL